MRYFTPDLYLRFNSPNEEEADQAHVAWETALLQYQEHLGSIRDRLPSPVKQLAESSFHDADLLRREEATEPPTAVLTLYQNGKIVSLIYSLWDGIREYPPVQSWRFSKLHTHWLYDEIDFASGGRAKFLHRVLLSDGRVLEIPFTSAHVYALPLPTPNERRPDH